MSNDASALYTFTYTDASIKSVFYNAPLTGTPTAPTASPYSANTTQVATTAFVESVKSNLLAGSYGTNTWGGTNLFSNNIWQTYSNGSDTMTFTMGANTIASTTYGLYASMSNVLYMATANVASIFSTGGNVNLYTSGASKTLTIAANGSTAGTVTIAANGGGTGTINLWANSTSTGTISVLSRNDNTITSTVGNIIVNAQGSGNSVSVFSNGATGTLNIAANGSTAGTVTIAANGGGTGTINLWANSTSTGTISILSRDNNTVESTSGDILVNSKGAGKSVSLVANSTSSTSAVNIYANGTVGTGTVTIAANSATSVMNIASNGTTSGTMTIKTTNNNTVESTAGDILVNSKGTDKSVSLVANSTAGTSAVNIYANGTVGTGTVTIAANSATSVMNIASNGTTSGTMTIKTTHNNTVESASGDILVNTKTAGKSVSLVANTASGSGTSVVNIYANSSTGASTVNIAANSTAAGTVNIAANSTADGTIALTGATINANGTATTVWGNTTLNLKSQSGDINILNSSATSKTITIETNSANGIINIKGGTTTLTGTVKVPNNTTTSDDYAASTKWVNDTYAPKTGSTIYAPKASPTFSGTVALWTSAGDAATANTVLTTDSSTNIATTQWVKNQNYSTSSFSTSSPTFTGTTTVSDITVSGQVSCGVFYTNPGVMTEDNTATVSYTRTSYSDNAGQYVTLLYCTITTTPYYSNTITIIIPSVNVVITKNTDSTIITDSFTLSMYIKKNGGSTAFKSSADILTGLNTITTSSTSHTFTYPAATAYTFTPTRENATNSYQVYLGLSYSRAQLAGTQIQSMVYNFTQMTTTETLITSTTSNGSISLGNCTISGKLSVSGTATFSGTVEVPQNTTTSGNYAASTYWVNDNYAPKTGSTTYAPLASPSITGTAAIANATFSGALKMSTVGNVVAYNGLAGWCINSSLSNSIATIGTIEPIICSTKRPLITNNDDRWLILPGFQVVAYVDADYGGTSATYGSYSNTTITQVKPATINTLGSYKVFFLSDSNEITISEIS